jgi:hypothetical protein
MEKLMPINSPVTGEGRTSWRLGHPLGLPDDFDYKDLRTRIDIVHFVKALPNPHRGRAAKMAYDHGDVLGPRLVSYAINASLGNPAEAVMRFAQHREVH